MTSADHAAHQQQSADAHQCSARAQKARIVGQVEEQEAGCSQTNLTPPTGMQPACVSEHR